jgi:hypothetical protein
MAGWTLQDEIGLVGLGWIQQIASASIQLREMSVNLNDALQVKSSLSIHVTRYGVHFAVYVRKGEC